MQHPLPTDWDIAEMVEMGIAAILLLADQTGEAYEIVIDGLGKRWQVTLKALTDEGPTDYISYTRLTYN